MSHASIRTVANDSIQGDVVARFVLRTLVPKVPGLQECSVSSQGTRVEYRGSAICPFVAWTGQTGRVRQFPDIPDTGLQPPAHDWEKQLLRTAPNPLQPSLGQ